MVKAVLSLYDIWHFHIYVYKFTMQEIETLITQVWI